MMLWLFLLACTSVECLPFCETPTCIITLCTVRRGDTPVEAWFETGSERVFVCDGVDCTGAQQEALNYCGPCEGSRSRETVL